MRQSTQHTAAARMRDYASRSTDECADNSSTVQGAAAAKPATA
jgi:hypothetical protein